jgi:hypothetical protein
LEKIKLKELHVDIDPELHKQLHVKCRMEDTNVSKKMRELIEKYIKGELT